MGPAQGGRDALDGQHGHPEGRREQVPRPSCWIDFYYEPDNAAQIEAYVNYVCPVEGRRRGHARDRPGARQQPADLPARGHRRAAAPVPGSTTADEETAWSEAFAKVAGPLAARRPSRTRPSRDRWRLPRRAVPYLLLRPGCCGWRCSTSYPASRCSWSRSGPGTSATATADLELRHLRRGARASTAWIVRSLLYGGLATILAFLLGFPLAYAIAFRGGRYKNLLLFLVIAPFFTSFLLRTI